MKYDKVDKALKRLGNLVLESDSSLDLASFKIIEEKCVILNRLTKTIENVVEDYMISSLELSKQEFAKELLDIIKEEI